MFVKFDPLYATHCNLASLSSMRHYACGQRKFVTKTKDRFRTRFALETGIRRSVARAWAAPGDLGRSKSPVRQELPSPWETAYLGLRSEIALLAFSTRPKWLEGRAATEKMKVALGGAAADGVLAEYTFLRRKPRACARAFDRRGSIYVALRWRNCVECASHLPGH